MAIIIKNDTEINKMRAAGKLLVETFNMLKGNIKSGVTTLHLDELVSEFIKRNGATASFYNYNGFPCSICASVNEQVIHGIPNNRRLLPGDVVSIDIGVKLDGYHSDAARTFVIEATTDENQKLVDVTRQSFFEGIKHAYNTNHLFDISTAIEQYVLSYGFSIVKDYVGHGIGRDLHEDPAVPNFSQSKRGCKLQNGMTLAIEPMVNLGARAVEILDDGWTVVTADNKCSAHYENTVLITDDGPEILTLTEW